MEKDPQEISLQEIVDKLWSRRLLIAAVTAAFGIAATIVAFVLTPKYEASIVLYPVAEDANGAQLGGGASSLLSQFGGIAGLAGVNVGGSEKRSIALATLQSGALTENFIAENNLLPVLFADRWDAEHHTWIDSALKKPPTLWKAEELFKMKVRTVTEDKKTGLVTLTINWKDPVMASIWAADLVKRTNDLLRERAINESNRHLDYFNEQLSKTSVVELQKAIYSSIEAEIKRIVVAKGNNEYAFQVIDPPRVPEERISPKRAVMVAAGLFIGLVIGMALAFTIPKRA